MDVRDNISLLVQEYATLSSPRGWVDMWSKPFGFLAPVHEAALRGRNLDRVAVGTYFLLPSLSLILQAYLLVQPGRRGTPRPEPGSSNRLLRAAVGIVTISAMLNSYFSYRFEDPKLNLWNCAFNVIWLHLGIKAIEFALLAEPIRDPYYPPRGRLRAAFDLCMNSRLLRMGSIGLDKLAGQKNIAVGDLDDDEPVSALGLNGVTNGSATNGSAHHKKHRGKRHRRTAYEIEHDLPPLERHEPRVGWRPRSRLGAAARHAAYAAFFYTVIDSSFSLIQLMAPDTLALGAVDGKGALQRFLDQNTIVLLPSCSEWSMTAPRAGVAFGVLAAVASTVYWGISVCYHAAAAVYVALGYEITAWDVDVFDRPVMADSVIDLWGRRWHQLFRHQFVILSAVTAKLLRLPRSPLVLFPLSFLYSGLLHSLGSLAMDPVAAPVPLGSFFVASSFACMLEVAFKRITGWRVRGPLGRIWAWGFLFATSRLAGDAWLDAGIAGGHAVPPVFGPSVARWLLTHAFAPKGFVLPAK